jgi:hypothetical protein
MSATNLYTRVSVYINGNLLSQEASVKLTRSAGLLPVHTTQLGFAGVTQGSPELHIEIDEMIPVAGFELNSDTGQFQGGGPQGTPGSAPQVVTLTLKLDSGQTLTSDGFIMGDSLSHAVNAETKMNLTFMGEWSDWM